MTAGMLITVIAFLALVVSVYVIWIPIQIGRWDIPELWMALVTGLYLFCVAAQILVKRLSVL